MNLYRALPDDCLNIIFLFTHELLDFHNLYLSCSFFSKGFSKNFIKTKFIDKYGFISQNFPPTIIELAGGIQEMIFYPIFNDYNKLFNVSPYLLEFTQHISLDQMKYPIMIGKQDGKSFISFVIKCVKKNIYKSTIQQSNSQEITYYVLSIYQRYAYFEAPWYSTEKNIFSNDLRYFNYKNGPIAGLRKGTFTILDDTFHQNLLRIIWNEISTIYSQDLLITFIKEFTIHGIIPNRYNPLTISPHYKI